MSSDENLPVPKRRTTTEQLIDLFKLTFPILLLGLLCVGGVAAGLIYGFPVGELKYATFTLVLVGPWLMLYIGVWVYLWKRAAERAHLVFDENHGPIGLKMLSPEKHRAAEVDGKRLPTRDSASGNGKVYLSLSHDFEQRERIDADGETETYRQRVISVPWEGIVPPWKVAERWEAYSALLSDLVPRLKAARQARASVDVARISAADEAMLNVIRGAEQDQFIDDADDPFGHDLEPEDGREFGDVYEDLGSTGEDDDTEPDARVPDDDHATATVAADGGDDGAE